MCLICLCSFPPTCAGEVPERLGAWVEEHGGTVLQHELSFRDELMKLKDNPEFAHIFGLWGSYLRVDIPPIMEKVRQALLLSH
jgi:hypothetical protein